MADSLETMFQNPVTALWAGQREGMDNLNARAKLAMEQEKIREAQQLYDQRNLTNPLEVQNKQLTIRGLEAGLPGITADSRRKGMEADTYGATQASSIAKTNSTNEYDVLANKVKQTDALVDILGKGAQALTKLPPAARHAAAYKQIFDMGGQPALDEWKGKLDSLSGDKLPEAIDAMAQHQAMSSTGMRQKLAEIEAHTDSQELIAKRNNATQLAIANQKAATAAAKVGDPKDVVAHIMKAKPTAEQAAVMFNIAANVEQDDQKRALYKKLADDAAQKKGEWINAGKPDIAATTGNAVPVNQITPFNLAPKGKPLSVDDKRAEAARLLGITK